MRYVFLGHNRFRFNLALSTPLQQLDERFSNPQHPHHAFIRGRNMATGATMTASLGKAVRVA